MTREVVGYHGSGGCAWTVRLSRMTRQPDARGLPPLQDEHSPLHFGTR